MQKVTLHTDDSSALNGTLTCPPLNVSVTLQDDTAEVISLALHGDLSEKELEEVLNNTRAVRNKILVKTHVVRRSAQDLELVFAFDTRPGVVSSRVPVLELESEVVTLHCREAGNGTRILVNASLVTSQSLQQPENFKLTLDGQRFTPFLPLSASAQLVQEYLNDLVSWECVRSLPQGATLLYENSYESDRIQDATAPRPYCGVGAKQTPQILIDEENEEPVFDHLYVSHSFQDVISVARLTSSRHALHTGVSFQVCWSR